MCIRDRNLTEYEEQVLINTVSELKINYIEEKKKPDESGEPAHETEELSGESSEEE